MAWYTKGGLGLLLWVALPCCAHTPTFAQKQLHAAATPLTVAEQQGARARMAQARNPLQQASLMVKTTRFGSDGRLRATLQVVVQRPNQFRITVLGPHGPPLFAVACDGARITALDIGARNYSSQPATPAGIAHHLGGLDMGLLAQDWVDLLLGDMDVPAGAAAAAQSAAPNAPIVWHWDSGTRKLTAVYERATGQLQGMMIVLGDGREGTLTVKGRNDAGMVEHLLVHLGGKSKQGAQDLEMIIGEVRPLASPLASEAFCLSPPAVPAT